VLASRKETKERKTTMESIGRTEEERKEEREVREGGSREKESEGGLSLTLQTVTARPDMLRLACWIDDAPMRSIFDGLRPYELRKTPLLRVGCLDF